MAIEFDKIYCEDCVKGLSRVTPGSVDLAFADPPFNIGYDYDVYEDRKGYEQYLDWTRQWTAAVTETLKPTGALWVAIGDEYAAEMKLILQNDCGLVCRSWVVWYYTFGVHCKHKFTRSHAHLFYFVKDAKKFTFNNDQIRVPSARQLVYADKRAVSKGRVPDDTWILRPQDVPEGFAPEQDTWYFSRVCGTFAERRGWHGCQMPEQLLGRIIKACSNSGDAVLDPFGGSGTTYAVAKKLGRRYVGFEISGDYARQIRHRLRTISKGDSLVGPEDPLTSAPSTRNGRPRPEFAEVARKVGRPVKRTSGGRRGGGVRPIAKERGAAQGGVNGETRAVIEAYSAAHRGFSTDRVVADPDLNAAFVDACRRKGIAGGPRNWNWTLFGLRKTNRLANVPTTRRTTFPAAELDRYKWASEIAMAQLMRERRLSLDEILCDPEIAAKLDRIASDYAPGHAPLKYRWAALRIRKERKTAREQATHLPAGWLRLHLDGRSRGLATLNNEGLRERPGVYLVLRQDSGKRLYVGEAEDLSSRFQEMRGGIWHADSGVAVRHQLLSDPGSAGPRFGLQFRLIQHYQPVLNWLPDDPSDRAA